MTNYRLREVKTWSGHGWLSQTRTGILFNTEAIKCKHPDIHHRSSLVYLDTEDYVEIELKLEFTKDKKHLFYVFFYNFGKVDLVELAKLVSQ